MTSQCTEKTLKDMIAEDMNRLKTQPMNSGAVVALVMEIKRMDLFRQQLENERIIAELADIP
jgi:hypothetical protein